MHIFNVAFILFISLSFLYAENDSIHVPLVDLDEDYFSSDYGFRGANWRGKDASDWDKAIRPGAGEKDRADGSVDYNCNGISGWSQSKGKSNENWLCDRSKSQGVAIFGDSAAAAFHIPESFIPKTRNLEELANLLNPERIRERALERKQQGIKRDTFDVLIHEFNWPHRSWATGFDDTIEGESIYMKMRERNRCNHRDFQNLAVNGASSRHLVEQVGNFSRAKNDKPVLAFVAYIGNDICKKKLEDMTTKDQFRERILAGLDALDKKIPAGSKVALMGLVDGRILWDTMHNRQHPIGMTYAELYDLLWDIKGNPCRTWLTSDENMRNKASERAAELSDVAKEIASTRKYQNFDLIYLDLPMGEAVEEWKKQGKDVADLIEVVDGFHPSHTAHRLLSKKIWAALEKEYPEFIGPMNPNNNYIKENFGEQGGH